MGTIDAIQLRSATHERMSSSSLQSADGGLKLHSHRSLNGTQTSVTAVASSWVTDARSSSLRSSITIPAQTKAQHQLRSKTSLNHKVGDVLSQSELSHHDWLTLNGMHDLEASFMQSFQQWLHGLWKLMTLQIIIDPQHSLKVMWDWFVLFTILYNTLALPFLIGFAAAITDSTVIISLDVATMIIMMIDIAFTFRTSFVTPAGELTFDARIIASRYLHTTQFIFDLLSTFPFFLFAHYLASSSSNNILIVNICKLPTVLRAVRVFTSPRIQAIMSTPQRRILRFVLYFLYLAHVFACGMYFIATVQPNGDIENFYLARKLQRTIVVEYIDCLYWSMETMCTVGYGDNVPVTVYERAYVSFVLFCTGAIYAAVFGNMQAAIATLTTSTKRYHSQIDANDELVHNYDLPGGLRSKLSLYRQENWNLSKGFAIDRVLTGLPTSVQVLVLRHMNATLLRRVPLFRECSVKFLESIIVRLHSQVCMPGDYVFREGDMSRDMYFIKMGAVDVLSDNKSNTGPDEMVIAHLNEGSPYPFFGEISLLLGETRTASVRASSRLLLMKISVNDFVEVMSLFPNEEDVLREVAMKRLRSDLARMSLGTEDAASNPADTKEGKARALAARVLEMFGKKTTQRIALLMKDRGADKQTHASKFKAAVTRVMMAKHDQEAAKSALATVAKASPADATSPPHVGVAVPAPAHVPDLAIEIPSVRSSANQTRTNLMLESPLSRPSPSFVMSTEVTHKPVLRFGTTSFRSSPMASMHSSPRGDHGGGLHDKVAMAHALRNDTAHQLSMRCQSVIGTTFNVNSIKPDPPSLRTKSSHSPSSSSPSSSRSQPSGNSSPAESPSHKRVSVNGSKQEMLIQLLQPTGDITRPLSPALRPSSRHNARQCHATLSPESNNNNMTIDGAAERASVVQSPNRLSSFALTRVSTKRATFNLEKSLDIASKLQAPLQAPSSSVISSPHLTAHSTQSPTNDALLALRQERDVQMKTARAIKRSTFTSGTVAFSFALNPKSPE